jgi:phosphoglycerol transferase
MDTTTAPTEGPAERPAPASRWLDALGYLAAVAVTLAAVTGALRLWRADLTVPLFDGGDNLMAQLFVKNVIETGYYHRGPRVGAPGEQNLLDYPMADALHFQTLRLLACLSGEHSVVLNLFILLPFLLIPLTSYFALRRIGLGRPEAVAAAALYACAPYHFARIGHHVFLCCYYVVPLMILVILRVYLGWGLFRTGAADDGRRPRLLSWEVAGAVLVCLLTGLAGIYYAFFSCFLLLAAGVRVAFREGRWRALLTPALLAGCVTAAAAAALAPALVHQRQVGKNPWTAKRLPCEAELYGLKVTEMLMPPANHRSQAMQQLRVRWFDGIRPMTSSVVVLPIGALASAGFLLLLGRFLWYRPTEREGPADGLAYLSVMAVGLASVGGFGALFAYFVSPMIRCYDRFSILVAFFATAGLFLALGAVGRAARGGWPRAAYLSALAALLTAGLYDQIARIHFPIPYADRAAMLRSDRDFARRIEDALPPGAMVYQMPYMPFPEACPVHQLGSYELFRPYFHTRTLRWSHGAVFGREAHRWLEAVSLLPLPEAAERLALTGFRGVYLDRRGFVDGGAATESELTRLLGVEPMVSPNRLQTFFDMTGYAQGVRDRLGDRAWQERRAAALAALVPGPSRRR